MPDFKHTVPFEDVTAEKETPDALLCNIEDKKVWIPKSQISDDSEVYSEGHEGTLIVSEWIAEQKGLV